jgi:hypothetical protein
LAEALLRAQASQVVIPAAGMDVRAYRLAGEKAEDWPKHSNPKALRSNAASTAKQCAGCAGKAGYAVICSMSLRLVSGPRVSATRVIAVSTAR